MKISTDHIIVLKHDFTLVKKSSEFFVASIMLGSLFLGTITLSSLNVFDIASVFGIDLPNFLSNDHITILSVSLIFPALYILLLKLFVNRIAQGMMITADRVTMLYPQGEFSIPFSNIQYLESIPKGKTSSYPFLRLYVWPPVQQHGRVRKGIVTFVSSLQLEGSGYSLEQIAQAITERSRGKIQIKHHS